MPETPGSPPARRRAAALHYEPGARAPQVTAAGAGLIAERIIEEARRAGVPVRHAPALTEALSALAPGAEIPEPLWRAVAEALAWAYRLERSGPTSG